MFGRLVKRAITSRPSVWSTRFFASALAPENQHFQRRRSGLAQYEVNVKFKDLDVKKRYMEYLMSEHIGHVMDTVPDQYFEASLSEDMDDELKVVIRYYVWGREGVDKYLKEFSTKLRDATYEKFTKDEFQPEFRRVLVETERLTRK